MTTAISGLHAMRALAYALAAVPKGDDGPTLQHISFSGNLIVGADGERWQVGLLPDSVDIPSIAVTRLSVEDLMLGLEYARRIATKHMQSFEVRIASADGPGGLVVEISYGGEQPIQHRLDMVDAGPMPDRWEPPVRDDAPELSSTSDLNCGHIISAAKWFRSWEKDHGTVRFYGDGGSAPVRADLTRSGDLVCRAYILPVDHPPAQLAPDEPLLAGTSGERRGQSNLDLIVDGAAKPAEPKAKRKRKGRKAEASNGAPAEASEGTEA